jgi:ribosome-associated translation inhibitor RaiA
MMTTKTDFTFEFYSEIPNLDASLKTGTERQLRGLARDHTDMIGASVSVEELTGATTPHVYQARVVVYMRPNDIVAVEKEETAEAALQAAFETVERQVRECRAKLREQWKQP